LPPWTAVGLTVTHASNAGVTEIVVVCKSEFKLAVIVDVALSLTPFVPTVNVAEA